MSKSKDAWMDENEPNYEQYADYLAQQEEHENSLRHEGAHALMQEIEGTLKRAWEVIPREYESGFREAAELIRKITY